MSFKNLPRLPFSWNRGDMIKIERVSYTVPHYFVLYYLHVMEQVLKSLPLLLACSIGYPSVTGWFTFFSVYNTFVPHFSVLGKQIGWCSYNLSLAHFLKCVQKCPLVSLKFSFFVVWNWSCKCLSVAYFVYYLKGITMHIMNGRP